MRGEQRVEPDLNTALTLKSLQTLLPDPLINVNYVREVESGLSLLLPFPVVLPWWPGYRGRMDEGARITIPYEGVS